MVKFTTIENETIFTGDFNPLLKNNEIDFESGGKIAVIYGPNGTGKTSLIKVLSNGNGTKLEYEYDGQAYTSGKDVFHIINDQNNRNIIMGETKDFFLGDNIRREHELFGLITTGRKNLIGTLSASLKANGISAANSLLIDLISDTDIVAIIKDVANAKSKGEKIPTERLISKLGTIIVETPHEYDEKKLQFLQADIANKEGIIKKIEKFNEKTLSASPHVHQIEENTEAINILERFQKDQCIVCDTAGIDSESLLSAKKSNREAIIKALSDDMKTLIENIINLVPSSDPFQIKPRLVDAIGQGNNAKIIVLLQEVAEYKALYSQIVLNSLAAISVGNELQAQFAEYQTLINQKPEITQEDELYIQEIVGNSMDKPLTLERDNNNLKILLLQSEVLGKDRNQLPLSAGEQNFLSLTFEFLKAKNSPCPVVVIDDPISSFDSIYKNKVVYAIVKILQSKKRIVLTHNTDLLRLLNNQHGNCYNLYLLNNTYGGENGFIALSKKEQELLVNLEKLLATFRNDIFSHIHNAELFLISMVPFMRGYANITNNKDERNELTKLMHGYMTDKVDIAGIYKKLFQNDGGVLPSSYEVSVADVLSKTIEGISILDTAVYPLLNKTLRQSFIYLFLRLKVEKALVAKFNINIKKKDQLGAIIDAAYPSSANNIAQIRKRIQLTSKKTLLNEFNHFEGNLSIFQPAIDITDQALIKEQTDIEDILSNL